MSLKEGYTRPNKLVFKAPVKEKKSVVVNGIDLLENVPPRTENEVTILLPRHNEDLLGLILLKGQCNCVYGYHFLLRSVCIQNLFFIPFPIY